MPIFLIRGLTLLAVLRTLLLQLATVLLGVPLVIVWMQLAMRPMTIVDRVLEAP